MSRILQPAFVRLSAVGLACLALSSCSWQTYAVARGIHYATGSSLRVHVTTPFESDLSAYRVIEISRLQNLLPDQVSGPIEAYLQTRIVSELRAARAAPIVVTADDELGASTSPQDAESRPTLLLDETLDDYEPGYAGLRLVELGFNHIAVTLRFRLRDKSSGRVLGAASITAQDNRVTATTRGTINRLAKRLCALVRVGNGG